MHAGIRDMPGGCEGLLVSLEVDAIESGSYLSNQTQQQLRGPQLWKKQVAGKQST
jgi:hypothetical protein